MRLTPLEKLIIQAWRSVEDKGYFFQANKHERAVVGTRVGLFETRLRILDGSPDDEHVKLAVKNDVDLRGRTAKEVDDAHIRRGSGLDQAGSHDPGEARPRGRRQAKGNDPRPPRS